MGWFDKLTRPRRDTPSDLWKKCPACNETLLIKDLAKNLFLCSKCDHHLRMPLWDRIALLTDDNSFVEIDRDMKSVDPLSFVDSKPYPERMAEAIKKTDVNEAVATGRATLSGRKVLLGVMNFDFMGGSMGSVVGEKLTTILELGAQEKAPVIIVSASGGARMQEGIFSLMQMAKTSAAVKRLNQAAVPFISIMTDPTTGGVSASFASLGDVNIAEPGALIGFAGPRVIEQTIRQKLPEGFQRSKFLLEHGMLDCVIHRRVMKNTVARILRLLVA
ncbi:MAG TPA: acetyl-CoA carboxylase, carboxyltransferase subunit beta [Candidatus Rifleibacterium sp.]|nr:acetyl-CoA carboxylase, carboxyltransferase subunit beta [Candidatus Rifleibacterium sp.]